MDDKDIKIHERIAKLETKVDQIMTNHLVHLDGKIDVILNKLNKVFIWLIVITGLVLIHLGEGTNLVQKLLSIV